eukprot:UN00011
MVMHKQIAPKLLKYNDYKNNENPFNIDQITVVINNNKYDILFWNGASPNQCTTFQIYDHQKDKKYYYMNFRTCTPDIDVRWLWYDNDSSQFREYCLGSNVKSQIECSFRANLLHNFPMEFQKDGMFNNVNLTKLKNELIAKYGCSSSKDHHNKLFALQCGFDQREAPNRSILNVQQLTISMNGFSRFSRTVERINRNGETDFCNCTENNFNLRMQPIERDE